MKKLLSMLAVLAIVLSCSVMGIGTVAFAAEESAAEDFIVYDGVLEQYIGAGGDVVIPASLGVVEIGAQAFHSNETMTSLVIPEGVEVIGYHSIADCFNLEAVNLPYTLTEIAEHAFSKASLTEITIPGNCKVVGYGAFSQCKYLEKITLSYGVEELQVLCFNMTACTEIEIPETVSLITGTAFALCTVEGRKTVTICNPDCEIGVICDGSKNAYSYNWTGEHMPFTSVATSSYTIIVPENSQVKETLENLVKIEKETNKRPSSYRVTTKEAAYFETLEFNKEGYGTQKPAEGETTPINKADGEPSGNTNTQGGTTNNQNGTTNNSTNNAAQSGSSAKILIVIAIIGVVIVIAIIVVAVLASKGKIFGKKSEMPSPEMMERYIAMYQAQKAENEAKPEDVE